MVRNQLLAVALLAGVAVCLPSPAVRAAETAAASREQLKPQLTVRADRGEPVYRTGETLVFQVALRRDGKPAAAAGLQYELRGDDSFRGTGKLDVGEDGSAVLKVEAVRPGFVLCRVFGELDGTAVDARGGALVDPLEIQPVRPVPSDFDCYWEAVRDEVDAEPMTVKMTPVEITDAKYRDRVESFDVEINCPGGAPVRGYLSIPKGAASGSLPVQVSYQGAGVRSSWPTYAEAADTGRIRLDVNAHGILNGQPAEFYQKLAEGELKGYPHRNSFDRDKSYFHGMFQRVMRTQAFVKTLPQWDRKNLIAIGGSQGGAQALVAAGMDPAVTCCVAFVPALCDHGGILSGRESGWPRFIRLEDGRPKDPAVMHTADYFDAVNFARRIRRADCFVSTGLIDLTCVPSSVYAAYNTLAVPNKKIMYDISTGHTVPKAVRQAANEFIAAGIARQAE